VSVANLAFDEFDGGLSWVLDERMQRSSHALVDEGRVWLVDPVDEPEAIERATALGTPAAVLQLLDRHNRDCAALAARFDVPHLVLPGAVADSPFETISVLDVPGWHETALWWPERRVLVVAELVGTNAYYAVGDGPVGIHPFLRAWPPGSLRGMQPEDLLVGHGHGVHGPDVAPALERAFAHSRRDIPRLGTTLVRLAIGR
jgi:hypothetical protein